jgi:hypothetical protein
MKYPKKYLTSNPNVMKREIKKHGGKSDSDSSAYKEWDADYKSRKAGKGKKVETKSSKYTKKFKELYGEGEDYDNTGENILEWENFSTVLEEAAYEVFEDLSVELNEEEFESEIEDLNEGGKADTALRNKAKKTGFPLGILRQVYKRGFSAWKKGHVPGTTPQQWAMARVNSFATGGRTTQVSDGALYRQAKKARAAKRKRAKE